MAWTVTLSPLFRLAINLHYLTVVRPVAQAGVDSVRVRGKGIRANLELPWGCGLPNLGNEILGVDPIPLPKVPTDDQL